MIKNNKAILISACLWIVALSSVLYFAFANGDGTDPIPTDRNGQAGVYAFVEYEHDWVDPRTAFLKIMAHPESKVPRITGGYAQTDTFAFVRIRGIDVPRAMHHDTVRHRPHRWIERERENWDRAMRYVWNLTQNTRTLHLYHLKLIDCDDYLKKLTGENKILEADWGVYLGGAWHNLGVFLMQDAIARPEQSDDTQWDAGSPHYGLVDPNIPK